MQYINYDGWLSNEHGIDITGVKTYGVTPTRDVDAFTIPGRNGELYYDNGCYNNAPVVYKCKCYVPDMLKRRDEYAFHAYWLEISDQFSSHQDGYYKLMDSYRPDEYVMARVDGGLDPTMKESQDGIIYAEFDLSFTRMPQRFLLSGLQKITTTDTNYYLGVNDEDVILGASAEVALGVDVREAVMKATERVAAREDARPKLVIYGDGSVIFATDTGGTEYTINVDANPEGHPITIDCESRQIYYNNIDMSSYVSMPNGFPAVNQGIPAYIRTYGNITSVEIYPNWWRL